MRSPTLASEAPILPTRMVYRSRERWDGGPTLPGTLTVASSLVDTGGVESLGHIRWVGGGTGAGKTTVTRHLAERFGLRVYSSDSTIKDHAGRLDAATAPLLDRFRRMSMDERWVLRDPVTMEKTFPWFQGEGFDLLLEDLRALPADQVTLVEGFRLLPNLVHPHLFDPQHAVWLIPTREFRRAAFAARQGAEAFWLRTTEPSTALANLLQRDDIFTDDVAAVAERLQGGMRVDGTATLEETAEKLAERFGLVQ